MSTSRKATMRRLAASAYEMELKALEGVLHQDPTTGRWFIGSHELDHLLQQLAGQEVILLLGGADEERPAVVRTCQRCGRDYTDVDCPHCRANRLRLRGQ